MATIVKLIANKHKQKYVHDPLTGLSFVRLNQLSPDISSTSAYPNLTNILKYITEGILSIHEDTTGRLTNTVTSGGLRFAVSGSQPHTISHNLGCNTPIVVPYYTNEDSATSGTSTSAASPATDITNAGISGYSGYSGVSGWYGVINKFYIHVDYDSAGPQLVTLTQASCDTGAHTAANMQTKIRALGGVYAAVTVTYSNSLYVITSGTTGPGSRVIITPSPVADVTTALKIGTAKNGVEVAGHAATNSYVPLTSITSVDSNTVQVSCSSASVSCYMISKG